MDSRKLTAQAARMKVDEERLSVVAIQSLVSEFGPEFQSRISETLPLYAGDELVLLMTNLKAAAKPTRDTEFTFQELVGESVLFELSHGRTKVEVRLHLDQEDGFRASHILSRAPVIVWQNGADDPRLIQCLSASEAVQPIVTAELDDLKALCLDYLNSGNMMLVASPTSGDFLQIGQVFESSVESLRLYSDMEMFPAGSIFVDATQRGDANWVTVKHVLKSGTKFIFRTSSFEAAISLVDWPRIKSILRGRLARSGGRK